MLVGDVTDGRRDGRDAREPIEPRPITGGIVADHDKGRMRGLLGAVCPKGFQELISLGAGTSDKGPTLSRMKHGGIVLELFRGIRCRVNANGDQGDILPNPFPEVLLYTTKQCGGGRTAGLARGENEIDCHSLGSYEVTIEVQGSPSLVDDCDIWNVRRSSSLCG